MELTKIARDRNGNPRYVIHFLALLNDAEQTQFSGIDGVSKKYDLALSKAHTIGGKKYHTKAFGGGIVFQSYNTTDLIKSLEKLRDNSIN